jgi:hypothetical protein
MSLCVGCLSNVYVALYDTVSSAQKMVRDHLPAVFPVQRASLSTEDYIHMEAEIQGQIDALTSYVSRLDQQAAQCRTRARAKGVSRERQVALFAQCKRFGSLRSQAVRQIGVMEDSVLVLQSNSMGLDLAQTVRSVSRVCRTSMRGVDSESLIAGIEDSMASIQESMQMSSELHDTFASACNSMGEGFSAADMDEAELEEFLGEFGGEHDAAAGRVSPVPVVAEARREQEKLPDDASSKDMCMELLPA